MKIECKKEELEKALFCVQRATSERTTLPILENILLEAKQNSLRLYATDLEISIEKLIEVEVLQEGSTVVSAKILNELVSNIDTQQISIELIKDKNLLSLKSINYNYDLTTLPAEEFPQPYQLKEEYKFKINKNLIKEMIKKTAWASALPSEARIILTGVLMELKNNLIKFVATNAHRLVVKEKIQDVEFKDIKIIIPARALSEVLRIMPQDIEDVNIIICENQIIFRMDNTTLTSRILDGEFPPYQNAIPKEITTHWIVPTKDLLRAVKCVKIFAKEDTNIIKLKSQNNILNINATTQDVGAGEERINIEKKGDDLEVSFNVDYLIDILNNIDNERTFIGLTKIDKPVLIHPEGDESYIYVIMPIT